MFNANFVLLEKSDGNNYLHFLTHSSYVNEVGISEMHPFAKQISPEFCYLVSTNGKLSCCAVFDNHIKFFAAPYNEHFKEYFDSTPSIFTNYKRFYDIRFTYVHHFNHSMHIIVLAIEENGDLNQWYYDSAHSKNWKHYYVENNETCTIVNTTCITLKGTLYDFKKGVLKKVSKDLPSTIKQAVFGNTREFSQPGCYMLLYNGSVCVCDTKHYNIKNLDLSTKIKKLSMTSNSSDDPYAITEDNKVINLYRSSFVNFTSFGKINDIISDNKVVCLRIDDYFYVKYNHLDTDKFQQVMCSEDNGNTSIPALFKPLNTCTNIKSAQTFG